MQEIKLKGFRSWGGKTWNIIAIQLVLHKCCKTSFTVCFLTHFTVPLNLTGNTKRKRNHEKDSKHSIKMTLSCKWPIAITLAEYRKLKKGNFQNVTYAKFGTRDLV